MRSDWLEAFRIFAEHLNFTHAAEALHLSQPALHAQVAKLADEVGAPLYVRQGRTLRLTATGEEVARFAREEGLRRRVFLEELREGRRLAPVVLAAGQGAYLYVLGAGIRRFRAEGVAPLRLWTLDRGGCEEAVGSGRAHLGVTAAPDGALEGWEVASLGRWAPSLVVPEGHRLAGEGAVGLDALEGERLVVPPPGQPLRERLAARLDALGVGWEVAVEASGWPLIMHFVALGLGLAVVNGCCQPPAGAVAVSLEGLDETRYVVFHRPGACEGAAARLKDCLLWPEGRGRAAR